jgi:ParB-like chromosome segregation protein Spo0J
MKIRDRVKELRRVRAGDLQPHPLNWRTHSRHQQSVLRGLLGEVGMAGALLARELSDGSLQLIDGHLRAETAKSAIVPVLVLDLSDEETEKVLLTHDPLAALAGTDTGKLDELLQRVESESRAVGELLGKLAREAAAEDRITELPDLQITPSYQVVVEVGGEAEQRAVYERMRADGYKCRVLTL